MAEKECLCFDSGNSATDYYLLEATAVRKCAGADCGNAIGDDNLGEQDAPTSSNNSLLIPIMVFIFTVEEVMGFVRVAKLVG